MMHCSFFLLRQTGGDGVEDEGEAACHQIDGQAYTVDRWPGLKLEVHEEGSWLCFRRGVSLGAVALIERKACGKIYRSYRLVATTSCLHRFNGWSVHLGWCWGVGLLSRCVSMRSCSFIRVASSRVYHVHTVHAHFSMYTCK